MAKESVYQYHLCSVYKSPFKERDNFDNSTVYSWFAFDVMAAMLEVQHK